MTKQVLLIDDDQSWLRLVTVALQQSGYTVLGAANATEAMQKSDGASLGLIVLDLNLGGESGLTFMKFLKHNHPGVPILIHSAMDHDDSTIRAMLDMGADQYLHKGDLEELLVTVGTYFKQLS
jgi:DNA-binding response OmpR family regulator